MVTPVLVPRNAHCWVCRSVAVVEDVTVRLFDEEGRRCPNRAAISYLRSIGFTRQSDNTLSHYLSTHVAHVRSAIQRSTPAPPDSLTRLAPEGGPARWLDVNQQAMDVGMDALRGLRARLTDMGDRELVSVARMGVVASHKQGDWEAKGRQIAQVDALIRLAAGYGKEIEGEASDVK